MRFAAYALAVAVGFGAGGVRAEYAAADKQHPVDTVLVIPFNMLNVPESQLWIGKGVQENIVTDLKRSGTYQPTTFSGQVIVEDNAAAARLARNANAPLAIRGTAQVVGDHVRITAQLVDAKSADTLRSASVTGSTGDLLALEDELSAQLRGQSTGHAPAAAAPGTVATAAPAAAAPVIIINNTPGVSNPVEYSNPYAYYENYGYYNPYWYSYIPWYPVVITDNGHHHDRDRDHVDHHDGSHDGNIQHVRQNNGGNNTMAGSPPNFNPVALPIPNTNLLPILNTNLLPIPVNNSLPTPRVNPLPVQQNAPLPTMRVAPLPMHQSKGQAQGQ